MKLLQTILGIVLAAGLSTGLSGNAYAGSKVTFPSSSTYGGKKVILTGELDAKKGNARPVAILMHGCGGLQSAVRRSLKSHASALRSAGFATLILDSFSPRSISGGWVCDRTSRLASAQAYRQRDVRDAVKYLSSLPNIDTSNVFVMGQSNGGSVVSLIANRPIKGVRAAAAFYPWCGAVPHSPKIPLLVLSGEDDDWTPPDRCQKIDKAGGKLTVVTYSNAVHSFDLSIPVTEYKGFKVGGNSKAKSDARRKMIQLFKRHIR